MKINKLKIISGLSLLVFLILYFLGPGWHLVTSPNFNKTEISGDIDNFVTRREGAFKDIKKNNESHIIWAQQKNVKTDVVLLYLHGFSASPKEISPVLETVAEKLKMNVYFHRFSYHGLKNNLMQNLTSDMLFQDAEDAFEIAKKCGQKVIIVGTSTGGTLALWLASKYPEITAQILISPNLGLRDERGSLAAGPLGYYISKAVLGKIYEWVPLHKAQEDFWSTKYDVQALRAMTDVVFEVQTLNFKKIQLPTLVFTTESDSVVNSQKAVRILKNLPSAKNIFVSVDTKEHVLAGEITAPEKIDSTVSKIEIFIRSLGI